MNDDEYLAQFRAQKYVKVMFDYSSSGVWAKEGTNIDETDLPVSPQLHKRIAKWVRENDYAASSHMEFEIKYGTEIQEPHIQEIMAKIQDVCEYYFLKSVDIAIDIKKELPDWTVMVYNEYPELGLPINENNLSEIVIGYERQTQENSLDLNEHLDNFKLLD